MALGKLSRSYIPSWQLLCAFQQLILIGIFFFISLLDFFFVETIRFWDKLKKKKQTKRHGDKQVVALFEVSLVQLLHLFSML